MDGRNVRNRSFFNMGGSALLLLAVVSAGVFCGAAQAQADIKEVFGKVAREWIQIGQRQYERGYYSQAEQTLLRLESDEYQRYMSGAERKKVEKLLEKIRVAVTERRLFIERSIYTAEDMMKLGKVAEARAHLEKLKADKSLSKAELALVEKSFKKLELKLEEQKKEIAELYRRSVELYQAGEFGKAREGFAKVVGSGFSVGPTEKAAEHYLVTIDKIIAQRAEFKLSRESVEMMPEVKATDIEDKLLGIRTEDFVKAELPTVREENGRGRVGYAEQARAKSRYIKAADSRTKILQSYLDAALSDAADKVENYLRREELDEARKAVETAEQTIKANRIRLGEDDFEYYSGSLQWLGEKIVRAESEKKRRLEEQRQLEALEASRRLREQRAEKVMTYLKAKRYKEALVLLEMLVAEALDDVDLEPK